MVSPRVRISLLVLSIVALIGAAYWYFSTGPIRDYSDVQDRAFIIKQFEKDRYWLLTDASDFDVEFMLDHKAPTTKDMSEAGRLIMKTYLVNGEPAAFVMYYVKELRVGQILFLAVDEKFRGKGIARTLMNYAIKALKDKGMLTIRMNTRTDNVKARKLYASLGFKQIWTDGAYIIYELIP